MMVLEVVAAVVFLTFILLLVLAFHLAAKTEYEIERGKKPAYVCRSCVGGKCIVISGFGVPNSCPYGKSMFKWDRVMEVEP